ncbi:MAG: aldehyde dehydrogenase family protein [Conexivisphaerales archaeon]
MRFDPLETIMYIKPCNIPVWQAARTVFPALMAGNSVVLKHSSIVTGWSLKLQEIIDSPIFRSFVVYGKTATSLIKHVDVGGFHCIHFYWKRYCCRDKERIEEGSDGTRWVRSIHRF